MLLRGGLKTGYNGWLRRLLIPLFYRDCAMFKISTVWFRSTTLAGVAAFSLLSVRPSFAEEWTSLGTNRTVQAAFLGMWQDSVVLRMSDGRRVVIEKAKLDAASRMQADDLAAVKAEIRSTRLSELKRSLYVQWSGQ